MPLTDLQTRNINQVPVAQRASLTALYESENSPSGGADTSTPAYYPRGVTTPAATTPTPTKSSSPTGTTTTTPTPSGTSTVTPALPNSATPGGGPDSKFQAAQNAIAPVAPPTADEFFSSVYSKLSPVLDAINQNEAAAERNANLASTKNTSAQNFSLNAQGLAGSSEADSMAAANEAERAAAIATAKATQATAIGEITKFATTESYSEYKDALARNDLNSQNYINQVQTQAQQSVKSLGQQGIPLDTVASSDPNKYQQLLQYYNGDTNVMKADWIAANTAQSLDGGKPIQSGTHLIYTFKDPVTGKTFTQDIDTGVQLDANWTTTKDAAGGLFQVNKLTGEFKQLTSDDPTYAATKEATLASKQAMLVSRYGTAVNNITKQLYPTPTSNPMNLYSNSLNYTTKLNEAYKAATSSKTSDKGPADLELIDSAVKINNGGQQVTDTQVNALFNSLSIKGKATIEGGKIVGVSALLTDDQRKAIHDLAQKNFEAQKANALDATKVIAERAIRAGVPAENLTTPEDILALSAAADANIANTNASTDVSALTSAGFVDNGDGTISDDSGTIYTNDGSGNWTPQ